MIRRTKAKKTNEKNQEKPSFKQQVYENKEWIMLAIACILLFLIIAGLLYLYFTGGAKIVVNKANEKIAEATETYEPVPTEVPTNISRSEETTEPETVNPTTSHYNSQTTEQTETSTQPTPTTVTPTTQTPTTIEEPVYTETPTEAPAEVPTENYQDYNNATGAVPPSSWTGQVLTPTAGTIEGPSGKETYYNLPMGGVVNNTRNDGIEGEYWVREDGVKMYGEYIMAACDVTGMVHNRYDIVETSLGQAICSDTGTFAYDNPYQVDIAVSW